MIKMMPISHQQSFLLARNFYNWAWPTKQNPWYTLPPMQYDGITPVGIHTISEFKIRPIVIKGAYKTVGTTESFSTALIEWERGVNSDTFFYPAVVKVSISSETGLYEFYVKLSNNAEYISEPFFLFNCADVPAVVGDYANATPNDDFNNDFWK